MDAPRVVPEGRTTALLTVVVITVCSIILPVACLLSEVTKHELSFSIVFTWNVCWFILYVAAISIFCYLVVKKCHTHVIRSEEIEKNVLFLIPTIVFGLATCCSQIYYSTRVFLCIKNELGLFLNLTKFVSTLFTGCLSLIQTGFIVCVYRWQCTSSFSRMLLAIIISQNMFFCVNNILDVFRASNTDSNNTYVLHNNNNHSKWDYFHNTLVFSTCNTTTEATDSVAKHVYKYVYSFQFEYCMFSLCFLLPIWNITIPTTQEFHVNVSAEDEEDDEYNEYSPLLTTEDASSRHTVSRVMTIIFGFLSRHSLKLSVVYVSINFAFLMFVELKTEVEDNADKNTLFDYEKASFYVVTLYTYVICVVPFFGYLVSRKNNPSRWKFDIWNTMLIVCASGCLVLVIFDTIDKISVLHNYDESHTGEKVIYLIDILLHFVGIYCQILFILKANDLVTNSQSIGQQYVYVKGILVFLFLVNLEHSFSDTFMTAPPLKYLHDIQGNDTYGRKNWWLITRISFPIFIYYRIFSALMCFKVYQKTRNWNDIS